LKKLEVKAMKHKNYFLGMLLILMSVLNPRQVLSDSKKDIEKSLKELERIAEDIKQNSASIEALMRNFSDTGIQSSQDMVKVIKSVAPVRETDNVASRTLLIVRLNDEFPVMEQRDQWYHIRLPDSRNGWIHEDVVQIFSKPSAAPPVTGEALSPAEIKDIMVIVEQLIQDIYEQKAEADKIIANLENLFQQLSESEKQQLASLHQEFEKQKEKVIKYHIRADYFFTEYDPSDKLLEQPAEKLYQGIDVDLSLNMGKSTHSTEKKNLKNQEI